ncbi:MAG: metal-transporting ATPase, partial [Ruminiclostridium sp.]|nr:metal-transporting ATPase [Ruminiclostridium sp.]
FVPVVIGIAAVTLVVWLLVGQTVGYALARAISVLVISCPCALGLATPVAIMVGNGVGAKNGILFKTAVSLEETGKTQIIVLDKTGTVTTGKPSVTDVIPVGVSREYLIKTAASLEKHSEHPLAGAVMRYAEENGITPDDVTEFEAVTGRGLTAMLAGNRIYGGSAAFIRGKAEIGEEIMSEAEKLSENGKTPLFFASDGKLLGMIAAADTIRKDSADAVKQLKALGLRVVMLTGDNKRTAEAIGKQAGIDDVIAGVLPDGKDAVIRELRKYGRTAMIGDGINDAPALTRADTGIAIGAGTDVAADAADVVLMKNSLSDAAAAVRLSRAVLRDIKQNLFWAFIYNIIGIPLAAGVYIALTGWELSPDFGAAAMSLSSFSVVINALRLNLVRIYNGRKDRPRRDAIGNDVVFPVFSSSADDMIYTIEIKGMMCPHCEATVRKCVMSFSGVMSADVSHEKGTAVLHLDGTPVDLDAIKKAINEKGYEVKE